MYHNRPFTYTLYRDLMVSLDLLVHLEPQDPRVRKETKVHQDLMAALDLL